ncbi:MAG: hypothetical protein LBT43_12295 [Prevotella sp.]|jgi:hypothetical protein|nr:hypothetical protein [Prevotella sp.]MDR2001452.1 hypothetical protein [Prevotella sp.]
MERYARRIIEVLHKNNIQGLYNGHDRLVYTCFEYGGREIFGLYDLEAGRITGYAIYPQPVPKNREKQISAYLSAVNRCEGGEGFYLDSLTGCIAFGIVYDTVEEDIDGNTADFGAFCMKPYEMFLKYQEPVDEIINIDL